MPDSKKRVPAEDLSAYERWELPAFSGGQTSGNSAGFQAAPKRADKLPTAGELEHIRKAAYEEGFAEGKRDGLKAGSEAGHKSGMAEGRAEGLALGKAEGQQKIEQALASLSNMVTALADPIAAQEQQVVQAMANISIAVARSVIHRELHMDSAIVRDLIGRILGNLPELDSGITLMVSPGDLEYAEQAVSQSGLGVKIESSPRIHPGGCTVSSSRQLIDYTVEKRFQKTVQEMLLSASQHSDAVLAQESPSELQEQSEYAPELLDEVAKQFAEDSGASPAAPTDEDDSTPPEDKAKADEAAGAAQLKGANVDEADVSASSPPSSDQSDNSDV